MKKWICFCTAAVLVLSLAACSTSSSSENDTQATENVEETSTTENTEQAAEDEALETVTAENAEDLVELDVILDWYPNAVHTFLYVAAEKGYFAEEGLEVNIQFPSNENDALSLVAAGKADIGIYYQQDIITTRTNQDVPVKAIGAITQEPLNIILSLSDEEITEPADLEGKTIGYGGTDISAALVEYIMEETGVEFEEDQLINVGFDLISSMTTGNVDATIGCMVNHEVPELEEEGFEVNYFYLDDYGVPSYYELVFLSNDEFIENDAETLAAFLRACEKGFDFMQENPKEALEILLENQNAENFPLSETVEEESLEILLPVMEEEDQPFLSMESSVWEENISWLYEQGLTDEMLDAEEFYTEIEY